MVVRRGCTGQNFPGVQPRERSLEMQPRERGRVAHPGLKFLRRERRRRCRLVFVDGKLARGPHTRSSGGATRTRGRLHERVT